jgi:XRE family transcriptional regulator, fatty acid utilization regulator
MKEKLYVGPKLRLLREQSALTLEACAERLGMSASYLSQIETNQRPVTARVLIALARVFSLDPAEFDVDEEDRLIADLKEASADLLLGAAAPGFTELKLAAATTPALARQFLLLHRAYRGLEQRLRMVDDTLALGRAEAKHAILPYEEVRDFFHYRDNYVHELDLAAEDIAARYGFGLGGNSTATLEKLLTELHGVRVVRHQRTESGSGSSLLRRFDPESRVLTIDRDLSEPTATFQLATQLCELQFGELISNIVRDAGLKSPTAHAVARVGLSNYAAGALLMPYKQFAATALELRHDVEQMQRLYHASFEQICHRFSTLQRPGARGIPFYFVRVDRAGNITKRHSSTRFQFARFGGACPLWNVHEAFGHPGQIMVQLAEMPDGVRYLCVGRAIVKRSGSYLLPNRHYAVGLGCEATYAPQLVYSEGIPLDGPAVRIGVSCRICERTDCPQRAFPPVDRNIQVPQNERRVVPYQF